MTLHLRAWVSMCVCIHVCNVGLPTFGRRGGGPCGDRVIAAERERVTAPRERRGALGWWPDTHDCCLASRSHMGNTQAKLRKDVDPAFLRPAGGYTYTGCTPPPPAPAIAHPWGPQGARRLTPFFARLGSRCSVRGRGGAHAAAYDP